MFLTRLNSTASAWKSSEVRIRCSASARRRARSGATSAARGRRRGRSSTANPRCSSAKRTRSTANASARLLAPTAARPSNGPCALRRAARRRSPASTPVSSGRSIRMRTMPCICRRSPKRISRTGGLSPRRAADPSTVSSLSASEIAAHVTAAAPSCVRGRRRIRFDADRQVVVIDRLPDGFRLPFFAGVDAAHRPLQLGELEDHVGREIGFREPGGRCRLRRRPPACPAPRRRSTRPAARFARSCRDSCQASCERATVCSRSCRDASGDLRSLSQKNRASRSRAGDDALGVLRDQPLVLRLGVDDGEEGFLQLAAIRDDREIVLMVHERRREHLLRQGEERRIVEPGHDARDTRRGPRPRRAGADAPSTPPAR